MATTVQNDVLSEANRQLAAVIQVDSVSHNYGNRRALNGVSFTVGAAEIFALLGPNGSGKTTLFRILSTLMLPTSGRTRICGFDAASQPDSVRGRIGVVFQAQSVDIKLTAGENLWHQGHLYGLKGSALKQRVAEMLQRVGLADRANDRVQTFSGGMLRRVELAQGLMHRPKVLLLDEPTTGLDPGARRDLWQYLHELRDRDGVSIIVTTHLMEEADRVDRLALRNSGEGVAMGTPADLRSEIGGDVILLEKQKPQALALGIERRFAIQTTVLDGKFRRERKESPRFITDLAESFPPH